MKSLDRKLLRDLSTMIGQVFTIALVVTCGVAGFIAAMGSYLSLSDARDQYYAESRFADLFVSLKRAPDAVAAGLAEIPGIAQVETRIASDVTLDLADEPAPAVGHIVSLPETGRPAMNLLHLRSGRWPKEHSRDEVLVNEGFAQARGIAPGSTVYAVLNGKRQALHIVGIALSPEFVYAVRGSDPVPDDRRFAVFWMVRRGLAAAFNMDGAFNDVVFRLSPGASKTQAMADIDRVLEPYGGLGAFGREDQPSSRFVTDEIAQQGLMASTVPVVLLAVASFLLSVALSRTVTAQREQIATLKALGYANGTIAAHYLKFVAVVIGSGLVPGIALGIWMGQAMIASYRPFFRFPEMDFHVAPWVVLSAAALTTLSAAGGAVQAVRRVVALAPAEAMRPPAPARYRMGILSRLGVMRLLPARFVMALRNVTGRPWRFMLTVVTLALSLPIVVLALFWTDAIDFMVDTEFARADRANLHVAFTDPVAARALHDLARLPGARVVEGFRAVPVRLRAGAIDSRVVLQGLSPEADLRRPLDARFEPQALPADGVLLTDWLARKLAVRPGDRIIIEVLEGKRPIREVTVAGLTRDLVGLTARMRLDSLNRLLGEGPTVNGASLLVDPRMLERVYAELKETPKVSTVTIKGEALRSFLSTSMWLIIVMSTILTLFAAAIGIGVVYNNARISLSERAWELASVRVLGLTRGEVAMILLLELAVEVAIAIPIGLGLSYWAVRGLVAAHSSDSFRIPPAVAPSTYAFAVLMILIAAGLSAFIVRRRLDRLDLVAVLKTRE